MSPKKNAASPEARAEEVLRRGKRVRAQELVSLIHEINSTGRELAPEVDRRRYALKSKLQSLLVREFPEELTVEPLGESGVVGLRYRPQDRDACHAIIGELDEDARSWVRRALDVRDPQAADPRAVGSAADKKTDRRPTKTAEATALAPAGLLRLGSEALEAYDFERARECFDQAFEDSDGEAAPASALLEFLVDNLAAYHDALECQRRLATSHSSRLTFALYDGDASRLVAFEAGEGALREVWQVQAPPGGMACDGRGGRAGRALVPELPGSGARGAWAASTEARSRGGGPGTRRPPHFRQRLLRHAAFR